jgi:hypothetical protein
MLEDAARTDLLDGLRPPAATAQSRALRAPHALPLMLPSASPLRDVRRAPAVNAGTPQIDWHPAGAGDYETMLIELWAYLADILTFYQERIANEAYLRTATQRDSLLRLSELISFRPAPGVGATSVVAFTAAKDSQQALDPGFRVGAKPPPGKAQLVFETAAPLLTSDKLNLLRFTGAISATQFAALRDYAVLDGRLIVDPTLRPIAQSLLATAAREVFGDLGPVYLPTFGYKLVVLSDTGDLAARPLQPHEMIWHIKVDPGNPHGKGSFEVDSQPAADTQARTRSVVLDGTSLRLAVGDNVLLVEGEQPNAGTPHLFQLTSVTPDPPTNTTLVTWLEMDPVNKIESGYAAPVSLYVFRVKAKPFGNNAPNWVTYQTALSGGKTPDTDDLSNWDNVLNPAHYLPATDDSSTILFLDRTYDQIKASPEAPGWILLHDPTANNGGGLRDFYRVTNAQAASKSDYGMTGTVTCLTLDSSKPLPTTDPRYAVRTTLVLAGNEKLPVSRSKPLPSRMAGEQLILEGDLSAMHVGRLLVVGGPVFDPSSGIVSKDAVAEVAGVADVVGPDPKTGLTTLTLATPLANQYDRASATVMANVARADQGESVPDEILGSGDGSPTQTYALKRKPLTYLPAIGPDGQAVLTSTLRITVNGTQWNERETLAGAQPDDQIYVTNQDDSDQTTVIFGDGAHGARPPTGIDNIHASYRVGLGTSGNVPVGGIAQLLDNVPGLQKVSNPMPAEGGVDRDTSEQIRAKAPAISAALGRAVSADDYGALALTFGGIAKARSVLVPGSPSSVESIQVVIGTSDGNPLVLDSTLAREARSFLTSRSPGNILIRFRGYTPAYLDVAATIDLDEQAPVQATLRAARAAVYPGRNPDGSLGFFAYERMELGQPIYLSAVYAALQAVNGVSAVRITRLGRVGTTDPPGDLYLKYDELPVVRNDPSDTQDALGKIAIILGQGGFIDQ